MSTIFSAFCAGTGHKTNEPNSTVGNLGLSCVSPKLVVDGVGTSANFYSKTLGNARGYGMESRVGKIVERALACRAEVVNMVGHSRGAVICHMVANEIAKRADSGNPIAGRIREINIFAIDPVNMSIHTNRGRHLRQAVKLGDYVGVIMENVTNNLMFPTATLRKLDIRLRDKLIYYNMPGTHGSGTQPFTTPIGLACHGMAMRFMTLWGTEFNGPLPTAGQMCEAFARIRLEHPIEIDGASGRVRSGFFSDDKKGLTTNPEQVAWNKKPTKVSNERAKALDKYFSRMAAGIQHDYRNTPFFINEYHADCFRTAFPAIYSLLATGNVNGPTLPMELAGIEARFPSVQMQLSLL